MTNKQLPLAKQLNNTIRRNTRLIEAIYSEGVYLSVYRNQRRYGFTQWLTEAQYQVVEGLILQYLAENKRNAEIEQLKLWKGDGQT